jgi:hypothetical protein
MFIHPQITILTVTTCRMCSPTLEQIHMFCAWQRARLVMCVRIAPTSLFLLYTFATSQRPYTRTRAKRLNVNCLTDSACCCWWEVVEAMEGKGKWGYGSLWKGWRKIAPVWPGLPLSCIPFRPSDSHNIGYSCTALPYRAQNQSREAVWVELHLPSNPAAL